MLLDGFSADIGRFRARASRPVALDAPERGFGAEERSSELRFEVFGFEKVMKTARFEDLG